MNKSEKHLRFAVLAVDVAIFTLRGSELLVRMMKVDRPPHFKGTPGLPGGLIHIKETSKEAVIRIVKERGELDEHSVYTEQLYAFSDIDRDPRGRVVSVGYLALVPWENLSEKEKQDTKDLWWGRALTSEKLAYDHNKILDKAVDRIRSRIRYTTLISKIIPEEFSLSELEAAFKNILGVEIDKRNFRKKIQKLKILKSLKKIRRGEKHRPAELYSFKSKNVLEIESI